METSLLLTKIIGPILVVAGLGLLINQDYFTKVWNGFAKDQTSVAAVLASIFSLLVGIIIVLNHNIWELSGNLVLTLIGWCLAARGAVGFLLPDLIKTCTEIVNKNISWLLITKALVAIAVGGYLLYVGYFMAAAV